jgi:hypothetical protein
MEVSLGQGNATAKGWRVQEGHRQASDGRDGTRGDDRAVQVRDADDRTLSVVK